MSGFSPRHYFVLHIFWNRNSKILYYPTFFFRIISWVWGKPGLWLFILYENCNTFIVCDTSQCDTYSEVVWMSEQIFCIDPKKLRTFMDIAIPESRYHIIEFPYSNVLFYFVYRFIDAFCMAPAWWIELNRFESPTSSLANCKPSAILSSSST